MTMEWPSHEDFDKGILDILANDVKGESLHHLSVVAMRIVHDGLKRELSDRHDVHPNDVSEIRRLLTGQLIDSFADDTEFTIGEEIEIGDNAFYLLQDFNTNYYVVQRLVTQQKLVGTIGTLVAINTVGLTDIETKIGTPIQLRDDAIPDAPAIFLEDLRFITPEGKSHAIMSKFRALVPLNLPGAHPRVAVPLEQNATIS